MSDIDDYFGIKPEKEVEEKKPTPLAGRLRSIGEGIISDEEWIKTDKIIEEMFLDAIGHPDE